MFQDQPGSDENNVIQDIVAPFDEETARNLSVVIRRTLKINKTGKLLPETKALIKKDSIFTHRRDNLTDVARLISKHTGWDVDYVMAMLLLTISRNLGIYYQVKGKLSILSFRFNLYVGIGGPPNSKKSTIIREESKITNGITDLIYTIKQSKITFSGSNEAIAEELSRQEAMHTHSDEIGPMLRSQRSGNRYDAGKIEMYNSFYYGEEYTHLTRTKNSIHIPENKYATVSFTMHLKDITPDILENGFIRRTLLVIKTYDDIDPNSIAFTPEENQAYRYLRDNLIFTLAVQRGELDTQTSREVPVYDKKGVEVIDEKTNEPKTERVLDIDKRKEIYIDLGALEFMADLNLQSEIKAKEEQRSPYPIENLELITRIALNLTLWNIVIGKNKSNSLTINELREALSYVERINLRYSEIVGDVEDKDIIRATGKLVSYIHGACENEHTIRYSRVTNVFKKWSNKQFTDSLERGIRLGKIGIVILQKKTRSSMWVYNPKEEDFLMGELERRKNLTEDAPDFGLKIENYEFKGEQFNFRKYTKNLKL